MADQAPPEDVQNSNSGSSAGDASSSAGETPTFPDRLRVHALAKIIGVTSKQVLAKLGELGIEARSAQSSLGRDAATTVHTAFTAPEAAPVEQAAAEPIAAEPSVTEPLTGEPAPVEVEPVVEEPQLGTEPATDEPATDEPATDEPATTEPAADEPAAEESAGDVFGAATRPEVAPASRPQFSTPLFLQPEAPVEAPPKRRRSRKAAGPAEDSTSTPETDIPETAEATTRVEDPSVPAEADAAADTDTESSRTDTDTDRSEDDDEQSQPRRRRRGRRGRGRGRGEQSDSTGDESDSQSDDESGSGTDSSAEDKSADDRSDVDEAASDETEGEDKQAGERRTRRRRSRSGDKSETSEQDESTESDDTDEESDSAEESSEHDEDESSDGSSRRRRRRRRRRSSGESSEPTSADDDPPNTVVHEREPRNKSRSKDEVQGITGSTRLEAKRQRRRDGRDAGRRRPPILTESEFLARRESVDRVMVVREKAFPDHGVTTQVAVLEDGVLVEHFVTSSASASMVGNVYLGRVQNVLPSMEAAFIDIGRGRNGVLYAGEVNWDAAGLGGNSRKIEQALKPGDQVLVQVSKDPVGHKGARLTTQLSLAGRYLVYVPGGSSTGISRKLPDTERKRLKEILREIVPPEAGVIIRTAAEGVSEEELARDVTRLQAQWTSIEEASKKAESSKGTQPQTLYEEPDLLVKVIRDLFNEDFVKLVIEGDKAWQTTSSYIETVAADMLPKLQRHVAEPGQPDVFEAHRIDEQLAKALDRKVWLPSGGTLVIDRTEAMTVVDVNTGKFTGAGGNLEETVTRNNLEAAEEVVRQMRLRDIGGMIVVDFIDMVLESNRDLVLRRLTEALGRDRTRHQVSEVTSLGLVQMTRKKLGTGLVEAFSTTCEHCQGRGIVVHPFPVEAKATENDSRSNSSRGEGGSGRKRRGRDKSDNNQAQNAPEQPQHEHTVDPSVKRAHPVALAMAAHHDEVVADVTPADVVEKAQDASDAAPEIIDATDVAAVQGESVETTPAEVEVTGKSEAAEKPEVTEKSEVAEQPEITETGDGVAETGSDGQAAAEESAVAQPVVEEPVEEQAIVTPRRARRVARKAAAPTTEAPDAGTVFVIPATQSPTDLAAPEPVHTTSGPSTASNSDSAADLPVRKPRRRAAARPAGPPADE
ncbi:translation initiation factor IF-2 N-terminal domain-containing protein [Rhodococcoides kyotonense]|uniref:Ribonuclease E n=1 Tax=Rhodococcoides kyotonense TaxID=398843 RepID=A0A177YIR8_9NOCA|nr:translation initiation factor IF-2 N-terminal domain-containing protein [Rhodococcus kyotonensis]OAK55442.1 ribonuclease E [Rhodococcus kyotonensis]